MPKRRKGKTKIVQMGFRCAVWLSDKIHDAAAARGSSVNSEIARRLEASLLADEVTIARAEERERCAAITEKWVNDEMLSPGTKAIATAIMMQIRSGA